MPFTASLWSFLLSPVFPNALAQQDPAPNWNLRRKKKKGNKKKYHTADLGKSHTLGVTPKQLFANGLEINACLKYIDNNNLNSSLPSFEQLPFFCACNVVYYEKEIKRTFEASSNFE